MANLSSASHPNNNRSGDPGQLALKAFGDSAGGVKRWLVIAVLAAVVLVLALALRHKQEHRRAEAAWQLSRAMQMYQAPLAAAQPGTPGHEGESAAAVAEEGPSEDIPRFSSAQARSEAVLGELAKLERSPMAEVARLFGARVLLESGKNDEAIERYGLFLQHAQNDNELRFLAREGRGYAFEAAGKYDQALEEFRKLETESKISAERAQFHQARVIERKGDAKEAEKRYRSLLDKNLRGALAEEVAVRLAALTSAQAQPKSPNQGPTERPTATPTAPTTPTTPTPKEAK